MSNVSSQATENRYRRAFQGSCEGALQHWRLLIAAGVLGFTAFSAYEFVAGQTSWIKTKRVQLETRRILTENTFLERQVQELKEQERLISSDDFVLEKVVREKLRLTRPGEILYTFEENPANATSIDQVVAKRPPEPEEEETEK